MTELYFITSRLAVGTALVTFDDVDMLRQNAINAVLDCRAEYDDAPLLIQHPEISYLWNGIADWNPLMGPRPPIPASWFRTGWRWALPLLGSGGTVLFVHCENGLYRSPSMVYALLRAWGVHRAWALAMIETSCPKTIIGLNGRLDADLAIKSGW